MLCRADMSEQGAVLGSGQTDCLVKFGVLTWPKITVPRLIRRFVCLRAGVKPPPFAGLTVFLDLSSANEVSKMAITSLLPIAGRRYAAPFH
jgi:hypothetical protein